MHRTVSAHSFNPAFQKRMALICCALAGTANAQDQTDLFGDTVPVVLSASRLTQPLSSSPASITVIDAEQIRLSGARSVVDLLRLVPGFSIGRLVNGNAVATYNGNSERYNPRLQLIIDGRPTYVPLYGGIPWGELPIALNDIERVEVTRAPNAATFGPNSITAVVSITTQDPATRSGWAVNSEFGSNTYGSSTLSYYGSAQDLHYRMTLQAERDEGFKNIPDRERGRLVSLLGHWQLSPIDRLVIDTGATRAGHMELNTAVEPNDITSYAETDNAYVQGVWERSRSSDDSLKVQYYYNYYDVRDETSATFNFGDVTGDPAFNALTITAPIDRNSRSTRHELEIQKLQRLGSGHRIAWGGSIRQDSVAGRFIFNDRKTRFVSTQRLFAHSELDINENWLINSGVMIENNSISDLSAAPRFSAAYRYTPEQWLRLGYSRGTRTPLLLEDQGEVSQAYMLSNGMTLTDFLITNTGTVKPESIDVIDLSYHYENPQRRFSVDTRLAYHRQRDLIATLTQDDSNDTFDQISRSYKNRINYDFTTLELQLSRTFSHHRQFRVAYAYTFGEDDLLSARKLIPAHTLSLFGSYALDPVTTLSGEYYYTSEWVWDDVSDRSRQNRMDIRLEKQFNTASVETSLALQAELDLGGTVDYLESNQIDDRYFLRLGVKLP